MIRFLLKGLIRDKQRSFLPIIVVALGVMLTVFMQTWVTGVIGDSIEFNAKFESGHVKVTTRGYADNASQVPLDLALGDVTGLMNTLQNDYPEMTWVERTKFSGLVDFPNNDGETLSQGPAMGIALDLLSDTTREIERMNLTNSLVRGKFPQNSGEVLLSEEFSQKLGVGPGDEITLISSTMYGSMAFYNFIVAGTVEFGTRVLDRGTLIVDIEDARFALDMYDATGEILGFFSTGFYDRDAAEIISDEFNNNYSEEGREFSPYMQSMRSQGNMATFVDLAEIMSTTIILVFILVLSIVLWNTGLISGLRRYGEVGVRIAIGENKGHVYRSMISESVMTGIAGTVLGTTIGLTIAWFLQKYGLNFGDIMDDSAVMMPSTFRARITPTAYYIGFFPGVISTVIGTGLSGIGIFKRNTATLFKELE